MNSSRPARLYARFVTLALALTFVVVVLGAWVRLTHAGLGCPDWPGCYGTLTVPDTASEIQEAAEAFPARPLETGKAWREMIHRYFASFLGLVIFALAGAALANRRDPRQPKAIPVLLVFLVIGQGLLGMLTVTWLLKPVIVMSHLLGGLLTLSFLAWLSFSLFRKGRERPADASPFLAKLAALGLAAVAVQIALGGWTSANYAALACPDFPTCQTQWWPNMDLREGFVLWRGLGTDYEGGVLDNPARTAIHMIHRIGALLVTLLFAILLALIAARISTPSIRRAALFVGIALGLQLGIGISIVVLSLPLALATAHNGVAALLLLATINLNHALRRTHA